MPRPAASMLLVALAALAVGLGACGEEDADLLPGATAREITANLDTVQQLADEGDCLGAESAALQVDEQIEALDEVDPRLERALAQGADRLQEVVARCEEEVEATEPAPTEVEDDDERLAEELQKEEEKEEKEQEKKEGEEEKRDEESEDEGDVEEETPSLPPQAEGEGKGSEEEGGAPPGGGASGGVSPASPAGEGG